MNIFHLDNDPVKAAQMMCDKHVVKMIVEYAQLMSTAHRVLDGTEYYDKTKNGRKIKRWKLNGAAEERLLYKASHVNHPSNIWVRKCNDNYRWLYKHFRALCDEYTRRYGSHPRTSTKYNHSQSSHRPCQIRVRRTILFRRTVSTTFKKRSTWRSGQTVKSLVGLCDWSIHYPILVSIQR